MDPDAWLVWLPPPGMSATLHAFDLRKGGSYRLTLAYDDATTTGKSHDNADVAGGRFVEIAPGERLVMDIEFDSDDPAFAGTMRMSWEVRPAGNGSEVTFRATGVPPGITEEDHRVGLTASLAQLAAYVEA